MGNNLGFYIGNFFVAYYGLFIAAGIILASFVGWYQVRRYSKDLNDFIIIAAAAGLLGVIGAKLLYIVVSFREIDFSRILEVEYISAVMAGGFVFYGGLIGGLLGLWICYKLLKLDVTAYVRIAIPCLPIVHAFGRFGCSVVGCCYGMQYNGLGKIMYDHSLFAPNHVYLFPIQLTEAVGNLLIAAILLYYINQKGGKKGLELYLLLYGILRFILEFFRGDARRGLFFGLSTSQYISLAILLGLLFWNRWGNSSGSQKG